MFKACEYGILGRFLASNRCQVNIINPRDLSTDPHKKVDDKPYGGGAGVVMTCQPLDAAIMQAKTWMQQFPHIASPKTIYLSPQGQMLTQPLITEKLQHCNGLILIAGRYDGIDERVIKMHVDLEISVGDYIVSGGEFPAMILLDSWCRCLPNVLNNEKSLSNDSFSNQKLLQYELYTRPPKYKGQRVPSVLLSGNHQEIANWRQQRSQIRTLQKRKDIKLQENE